MFTVNYGKQKIHGALVSRRQGKSRSPNEACKALFKLAEAKGFKEDAMKAQAGAMLKVAEAHGFKADEMQELSEDELKLVSGAGVICPASSPLPGYWDGLPY